MRAGAIQDAYHIFNSLFSSADLPPVTSHPLQHIPHKPFIPLQFGATVSPRLTAHSLVHALVRVGLMMKARSLVHNLMQSGMKIQPRTLDAVVHGLLSQGTAPSSWLDHFRDPRISKIFTSSKVLTLQPRLTADQSTRYAVQLILRSRYHRQKYSSDVFASMVRYFLKRGELLFASLFVCMMVKDYQLRKAMAARLRGQIQSTDTDESDEPSDQQKSDLKIHLQDVLWQRGVLDKKAILTVVEAIQESLCKDPQQGADELSFHISLQALANIAMLLDERRIPFPEVSTIIRALYSCPRTKTKVWIVRRGRPVHVQAYKYFHDVLMRLAEDLPSSRFPRRLITPATMPEAVLPPLSLNSYNSLLHYALRHRLDPVLANKIIQHMHSRPHPLAPDIVTFNILIRSGTLLREGGISLDALESLRQNVRNADHGIMITLETWAQQQSITLEQSPGEAQERDTEVQEVDGRVQKNVVDHAAPFLRDPLPHLAAASTTIEPISADRDAPQLRPDPLTADVYTLTSYIAYLTSSGSPQVVVDVLFHVLPELSTIDHPSWGAVTAADASKIRKLHIKSRKRGLHRAVALGPRFFIAVLNTLVKMGKTGLAERVWILAKQAERASWTTRNVSGWLLPVHAYTIMLQCYAAEAKKGLSMNQADLENHGREDLQQDWNPEKRYVHGWAKFILSQSSIPSETPRYSAAAWMGMQLYNSMQDGAEAVFQGLMLLQHEHGNSGLSLPVPDARFFNAALDLFHHEQTSVHPNQSIWKRRLKKAHLQYSRLGVLSSKWHPMLQTIAQEMVKAGFSVPIGLRPMFIGRWSPGTQFHGKRQELDIRPFAFPPRVRHGFRPHRLATVKQRGLPVHRRTRARRGLTQHERTSTIVLTAGLE